MVNEKHWPGAVVCARWAGLLCFWLAVGRTVAFQFTQVMRNILSQTRARVHLGFMTTASDVPATCSFYSLDAKVKQCHVPSVSFVPPSRKPAHDVVCPSSHFTVKFLKFPSIDSVSLLICGHSVFCCLIKCQPGWRKWSEVRGDRKAQAPAHHQGQMSNGNLCTRMTSHWDEFYFTVI